MSLERSDPPRADPHRAAAPDLRDVVELRLDQLAVLRVGLRLELSPSSGNVLVAPFAVAARCTSAG